MLGVREERWKYILNVRDGTEELFDLTLDPGEQHNVGGLHPDSAPACGSGSPRGPRPTAGSTCQSSPKALFAFRSTHPP